MGQRPVRWAVVFALVATASLWCAPTADAEPRSPALEATLTPTSLPLGPGESSTAFLVLRNVSEERIDGLEVDLIGPPSGLEVMLLDGGPTTTLAPGSSTSVPLRVARAAEGVADEIPYQVEISYSQVGIAPSAGGTPAAPAIDQRTVAVGTVKSASPRELLTASFAGGLDPISEDRRGQATLVLVNPRPTAVTLTGLEIASPRSLTLRISSLSDESDTAAQPGGDKFERGDVTIGPGEVSDLLANDAGGFDLTGRASLIVQIDLEADAQLDPGTRSLVVTASVEQGGGTAQIVATQDVKVEVFGEKEILGVLGIPLIFLLPGLITLVVSAFLIARLSPWRGALGSGSLDLTAKASLGAVASIGISLVAVAMYPSLTGLWPGEPRNLRVAYGFADFQYIYVWSFAFGVLAWMVAWPLLPLWRWAFVPEIGDGASDLLRKLAWRNSPVEVDLVEVAGVTPTNLGASGPELAGKRFVFPPLGLRGPGLKDAQRVEFRNHLENDRLFSAWRLIHKLPAGTGVEYTRRGYIRRPMMAAADKAVPNGQRTRIVDVP